MMINIEYTHEFKKNLRHLIKKYPTLRKDIDPVIKTLQQGELLGDKIQQSGYSMYKVRVKNSDIQKGKSGGYRVIYYLQTQSDIILITIYSKSEQSNISATEIKRIIKDYIEMMN